MVPADELEEIVAVAKELEQSRLLADVRQQPHLKLGVVRRYEHHARLRHEAVTQV